MLRVVTALSGLVLVVLVLRLAMAPVFPLDKFVAPAIAAFEADTGAAVSAGTVDLDLLPTPRVVADDVRIELPDGLGEAHADRLVLSLRALPFLSGSAELSGVAVERPVLRLTLKGGDLDPSKAVATLTDLAGKATTRHFAATGGRLELSANGRDWRLDDVTASALRTADGERLAIGGALSGTPLLLILEAGATGAVRLRLAAPTGGLDLDGGLTSGAFAGRLTLSAPDVAASGPARIAGAATLTPGRVELVDADATLLGGNGRLSAALDLTAPRAAVDLHAAFKRLPVDGLAALARLAASLGFDPAAGTAPVDAGLDLKLAELAFPGGGVRDVRLTAVGRDGRFGAVLDDAALGNGSLSGRIDLVPDGGGRRLGGILVAKEIASRDVAALAGVAAPLAGRISAELRLSARGRSTEELAATLAADGAASLRDGRLAALPLMGIELPALTGLAADLTLSGLDEPARLSGRGMAPSGVVTLDAAVTPRRLFDGGVVPVMVHVDGATLSAAFDGGVDPFAVTAEGTLSLTSRRLSALAGVTGLTDSASLDGRLDAGIGRLALSGARLMLGDATFAGVLDLTTAGDRPHLAGRLSGDTVDVAALAGVLARLGSPARGIDADLGIEAARIAAGPVAAAGGPVDLRIDDKGAEIGLDRLSLGGGSGAATLRVTAGERPAFALKGKIDGARLASLAPLIGSRTDGELTLAADLNATGTTAAELLASAGGSADLTLSRGVLDGLDPLALLGRLARSVQTGFGSDPRRVAFDRVAAHLAVAAGSVRSDDLTFSAGDLQLSGAGSLRLADGVLDLTLKPQLEGYPDFEAPVAVKGPLAAPRLYPDLPGLIDDPAAGYARLAAMTGGFSRLLTGAAPALEAVKPDAVTSMIDTLTGPAKPAAPQAEALVKPATTQVEAPATPAAGPVETPAEPAVAAPLPPLRPAARVAVPRRPAAPPPTLADGPLDLGALGRTPSGIVPARTPSGACQPGRDGRCIP